jgi:carboxymethylenebutenolidase
MTHRRLLLDGHDGPVPADEVTPDVSARGAVTRGALTRGALTRGALIVVQEAFGVNDHIVDVCRRFAMEGYHAVAPHLFHREGISGLPYDLDLAIGHMGALTASGIRHDLAATRDYLATQGFSPSAIGIVGFCMGGSIAFVAAAETPYGAAVTFYGSGVSVGRFGFRSMSELAPELQSPWLGLYGDLDPGIPLVEVEKLRTAVASASVPTAIVRYSEAGHGFHCDARPANYHEASATDAWSKTLDWFARYLAGS